MTKREKNVCRPSCKLDFRIIADKINPGRRYSRNIHENITGFVAFWERHTAQSVHSRSLIQSDNSTAFFTLFLSFTSNVNLQSPLSLRRRFNRQSLCTKYLHFISVTKKQTSLYLWNCIKFLLLTNFVLWYNGRFLWEKKYFSRDEFYSTFFDARVRYSINFSTNKFS